MRMWKRLINLILVCAMVVGMMPATILSAFAANKPRGLSFIDGEIKDTSVLERRVTSDGFYVYTMPRTDSATDPYMANFANLSETIETSKGLYNNFNQFAGWVKPRVEELLETGVVLGIEDKQDGETIYTIPASRTSTDANVYQPLISGQEMFALALFYYKGSVVNGFRSYSTYTRQEVYNKAATYFSQAFPYTDDTVKNLLIGNVGQSTRGIAMLTVAFCIEIQTGARLLRNYSNKEIGKDRNGKKLWFWNENNNHIVKPADGLDIEVADANQLYYTDGISNGNMNAFQRLTVQAANMLIDLNIINGRNDGGVSKLALCEPCEFAEFYQMLWGAKKSNWRPGQGPDVATPISYIEPALSLSTTNDSMSYQDFWDGTSATIKVSLDSSASTSNLPVTNRLLTARSQYATAQSSNGTASSKAFTFSYKRSDVGLTWNTIRNAGGNLDIPINVSGSVAITDTNNETESATATGKAYIKLYNNAPDAYFTVPQTTSLSSAYNTMYYYVGQPVRFTDQSSDYEWLNGVSYSIRRNSTLVAQWSDYGTPTIYRNYLSNFSANAGARSYTMTFTQPGTYTITVTATDEMGATDTYSRTIYVGQAPAAPIAKIRSATGSATTFPNIGTTYLDASTDVNDDIVRWQWTPAIEYFEAELDENDEPILDELGREKGYWRNAVQGVDYTGSLSNKTRASGETTLYSVAQGTLTFKITGKFRLHLQVTDATGLSDKTEYIVTVSPPVPVPVPDIDVPITPDATYTVTFVNTDGSQTVLNNVAAGSFISTTQIPAIKDLPAVYEHGWTMDGTSLVDPATTKVNGNLTFIVYTTPIASSNAVYTVTFINTDGKMSSVQVPKGGKVAATDVPSILDLEDYVEEGWTADGANVVTPSAVTINHDTVFWVKKSPVVTKAFRVHFINTDGTVTVIKIAEGQTVPADLVPSITDIPQYTENGWTMDGSAIIDPTTVVVNKDLTFWVGKTRDIEVHTVVLINTNGERTYVEVPDGGNVPLNKIPDIAKKNGYTINGWTNDGENIVKPQDVPVYADMVFWVDTEQEDIPGPFPAGYIVTFVNTDGTVTTVEVPKGEPIPTDAVPAIKDKDGYTENGWTQDGENTQDPAGYVPTGDTVFFVSTTKDPVPDEPAPEKPIYKVIFVNTDGTTTEVEVPEGETIPTGSVPAMGEKESYIVNGWTRDGETVEDPSTVVVDHDIIFYPHTTPERVKHTVWFVNTDGIISSATVYDGDSLVEGQIPAITDVPGIRELGWGVDGVNVLDLLNYPIYQDMTFFVLRESDPEPKNHTVTFVNTDESIKEVLTPHGGTVKPYEVPSIVDMPDYTENGWTKAGEGLVDPTSVVINGDTTFWVDKDDVVPEPDHAYIKDGILYIKQNRAATVNLSASLDPPANKIIWEQTEWTFTSDFGYDMSSVKFKNGTAPAGKTATFMPKTVGRFLLTITLHNDFSDNLAASRPNSYHLKNRVVEIPVIVYEDIPPEVSIFVNNANPNFHDNPTSTTVVIASNAQSEDKDRLDRYHWTVTRDDNMDGVFDETPMTDKTTTKAENTVSFNAPFTSGIVGNFLAQLTVTEDPGQDTLPEYLNEEDYLKDSAEKEFEVNWTPCISYDFKLSGNTWAYVDDVITVSAVVKDENTSTCAVEWTLKQKRGDSYVTVDSSKNTTHLCPVWDFGTLGGKLRIPKDGYYVLQAVITDDHGCSETFTSNELRVYALPVAVIADTQEYRWNGVQWQYKQSRRFDLNGNSSYANDSTGEALHQINHGMDEWQIIPINDGAAAEAIYVLNDDGSTRLMSTEETYFCATANAFNEKLAIIEPGTYQVRYRVTNTYGKQSAWAEQLITIAEDMAPDITFKDGAKQELLGSEANNRYTTIGNMTAVIKSRDADIIYSDNAGELTGLVSARYRYDSNNDGNWEDETWVDLPTLYADNTTIINTNNGLLMLDSSKAQSAEATIKAHVNQPGWYQFELQVHEKFGQETLSILPDSVYQHFTYTTTVEVDNHAPNGTFGMVNNVYADIVFAFGGYEDGKKTISKETAYTFGPGGNRLDAMYGQKAITLQPNDYVFEVYGGAGGDVSGEQGAHYSGGNGAYVKTHVKITTPTTVYVTVGGNGSQGTGTGTGGYNGGGTVGAGTTVHAAGGGGASMISLAPGLLGEVDPSQILVLAAGGGGAILGSDGEGGGELTGSYEAISDDINAKDNYSAGGGSGYTSGDAGVTVREEVSYYDTWVLRELSCEKTEHIHGTSCYESNQVLTCEDSEHVHTADCYETVFTTECGLPAHEHDSTCPRHWQGGKWVYDCGMEEHEHTTDCYKVICPHEAHTHDKDCYRYYNYVGSSGRGGFSYVKEPIMTNTEVEADYWDQTGYVKIAYYTKTTSTYDASAYNEELLQKNGNFANLFGEVPGANLFQLNVSTVETSSLNMADGISWNTSQWNTYYGQATPSPDGLNVHMIGNTSPSGQNLMYCLDYQGEITFAFDYALAWGDSFNGAGIVMNIKENASNIEATLVWIPNTGYHSGGIGTTAGIYDIKYNKNSNSSNTPASYTLLKSFSLNMSGHLEIKANKGTVEVSGSGVNNQIYTANAPYHGDGFGFYSSHYSHGCNDVGKFDLTNIALEVSERKTLADTLSNVSFNVGNDAFVIWAEGTIPMELDPSSEEYEIAYQNFLQKVIDSNIHLIILGSNTNETVMKDMLSQLPVKGTFVNTGTVDGDLAAARDFVASILRQHMDTNVKYILLGEDTVYDKYYSDYNGHAHWLATGTEDNIYSSRWWYMQDADYFANSLGTILNEKTWLANEITNFDKVGHFYVDYRVKDNSVPDAYLGDNTVQNPFDGNPDRHLTAEELEAELRHGYRYWSSNYAGVDSIGSGFMYEHDKNVYDERMQTTLRTEAGEISNQPAEIYVHRRPIAETVSISEINSNAVLTKITITDASYDLDHNDPGHHSYTPTKGLQQYEWTYYWYEGATLKNTETRLFLNVDDGIAWINAMVKQYPYTATTDIKVLYRVRDIDGGETTERTTYSLTVTGVIYPAPDLNDCADLTATERKTALSYRHTYTDTKFDSIPAGTYITQNYDEAIYVLKVDEEHKLTRFQSATSAYNDAVADRSAKEQTAASLLADALRAEALRDDQQQVLENWRQAKETKERLKAEAEALLATYNTELSAANDNVTSAATTLHEKTDAYNSTKSAYDTVVAEMATLDGNITRLSAEYNELTTQLTRLNGELAELQATLTELEAADPRDEDAIANTQAAIATKEADITAKGTDQTTKQQELQDMLDAKPGKQAEIDTARGLMEAAQAEMDAAQTAYDTAVSEQTTAQTNVDAQTAVVQQYTEESNNTSNRWFTEKQKYDRLVREATEARSKSNAAEATAEAARQVEAAKKATMDSADAEWRAATAKREAVTPLHMNAKVMTTQTKDLTIPDGVWSVLESKEYTSRPLKPIAKFVTDSISYLPGQTINITDSSYSPNGNDIVKWNWTITRDGTTIGSKEYNGSNYSDANMSQWLTTLIDAQALNTDPAKNKYKITLTVTDNKTTPMTSDAYAVTITIAADNKAPTVTPNNTTTNIYKSANPIVYEYDAYDANLNNPFYSYNGTAQKRGMENLDWTLIIDDPDNHDKYGTANDSDTFDVTYQFERFQVKDRSTVIDSLFTSDYTNYGPKTVSIAQAKNNSLVAPFATPKDSGLKWGAYRITTTVTDKPNNGSAGKSASIITGNTNPPKHLYVIPALSINNIHYMWDGTTDTTEQIPVGDEMTVTFTTNPEVTSVYACMPNGAAVGGETKIAGTLKDTNPDGTKNWTVTAYVPDNVEEDDLVGGKGYTFEVEANTDYGTDTGAVTRTKRAKQSINVLAIKLFNFRVTDIADPNVQYDGNNVYVKDLAFDANNTTNGALMKKGYSFYFQLNSMGLKADTDSVRILPTFYAKGATGRYDMALDVYYENANGEYVLGTYDPTETTRSEDTFVVYAEGQSGSALGTMRQLNLDADDRQTTGKEQVWNGRYGLPSTAVFVPKGMPLSSSNLYQGDVLIQFQIDAMKGGTTKYSYLGRGQWAAERRTASGALANPRKAIYDDGAVILIDGTQSAIDNYSALPVWRKS